MDGHDICSVGECCKPIITLRSGLCNMHYKRMIRLGKLTTNIAPMGERIRFFNEVVIPHKGDNCLIWPFPFYKNVSCIPIKINGSIKTAPREACRSVHGEPPAEGYFACHSCGNGHLGCMNPMHLYWGTPKDNYDDMVKHGTNKLRNSKLSDEDVRQIIALKGTAPLRKIGAAFGVSATAVSRIYSGKYWKHIHVPSQIERA